jgi:hypothetical protein
MGQHAAPRQWWEHLGLDAATAEWVAARATDSPLELARIARGAPERFKRELGERGCADLARAVKAHLAQAKGDEKGYDELLAALEELSGKREPKPFKLTTRGYGAVAPHAPKPAQAVPPLPKLAPDPAFLPAPKPGAGNKPTDQN